MKFKFVILLFFVLRSIAFTNNTATSLERYDNPNMHFSANKFDSWEIRCQFSSKDEPKYWYVAGNWGSAFDIDKNEYQKDGPDSKAGNFGISQLKYYLYKGKNPLMSSSDPIMKRFYFYRFSGKAAKILLLDNYLVAVDTYTKLVFAFAVPTKYKNMFSKRIPEAWGALDNNSSSGKYKFYEYDPVGIVKSNGSVELYDWHLSDMREGKYEPTIGKQGSEVATYGKAGRSPYL